MKQDYFRNKILPLSDKLFRLALSITGNRQDAEDVVQDALLNVWKKSEWETVENPEAYCFRSVRNIAIDKISLKENRQEAWNDDYDKPDAAASVQERLEREEQLFLLENVIRQLPEKQRTVFQLREAEELNYRQIAEVMNISEEQVKVNLFRARQKIKTFFERLA
ncbi:MAG: RNA polymerase sigma factor [Dysgonamonadaceae bacterium]|jgi:RNA polymerase sigma-70 factor (ECF subfamily)|nr:RNA polymerase sigma factor [Dysgonamonadaceae bacterium]